MSTRIVCALLALCVFLPISGSASPTERSLRYNCKDNGSEYKRSLLTVMRANKKISRDIKSAAKTELLQRKYANLLERAQELLAIEEEKETPSAKTLKKLHKEIRKALKKGQALQRRLKKSIDRGITDCELIEKSVLQSIVTQDQMVVTCGMDLLDSINSSRAGEKLNQFFDEAVQLFDNHCIVAEGKVVGFEPTPAAAKPNPSPSPSNK